MVDDDDEVLFVDGDVLFVDGIACCDDDVGVESEVLGCISISDSLDLSSLFVCELFGVGNKSSSKNGDISAIDWRIGSLLVVE